MLKHLDQQGLPPVLRTVRGAPDLEIADGRGLRAWCYDSATDKDAGRLVALRLSKQPFIDGTDGLFALAEGQRAIEGTVDGVQVYGMALAALKEGVSVSLGSEALPGSVPPVSVTLLCVDDTGEYTDSISLPRFVVHSDVMELQSWIAERVDKSLTNGTTLLEQASRVFPRLRFGDRAVKEIGALSGKEPSFRQLIRHLRALSRGAEEWQPGTQFVSATAITFSSESEATLSHGTYGPMRDFPVPAGYAEGRWSLHTKVTGGANSRLYFRPERGAADLPIVLIGYFGPHLPTVNFPT